MVKFGNNEVIFSTSFVMDVHTNNYVKIDVPGGYPHLEYDLKLVDYPTKPTELPPHRWHDMERIDNRNVVSFCPLPEGKTEMWGVGHGQANQNFDVQFVRQAIWNNVAMLVHVIVLREPH